MKDEIQEIRYAKHTLFTLMLLVACAGCLMAQTAQTIQSDPSAGRKPILHFEKAVDSIESGSFKSVGGGFSLALAEMPFETREYSSETAKAKGIDAGKLYLWKFDKTIFTAFYSPPFDKDGNPLPTVYTEMESATRKGIIAGRGKLISEKRIKFGDNEGTEFRYESAEGIKFIGRIFLIGDIGYQIVGAYAGEYGESEVLKVLDSFELVRA